MHEVAGSMALGSAASAMGIVCWWRSRWWTRRQQNACTTFAFWHERCKRVFLMFLARVISNGYGCQKQHIPQRSAIDRSIGVRWHGADQFLASRNIHGTFKQTWFALFVKTTLSLRDGGVDVTRRIRVPSHLASGLSALAPAQRAGAQRLRALAQNGPAGPVWRSLFIGVDRK